MTAMLDTDQLRTFIAISETGSFTKAAEVVNKNSVRSIDADEAAGGAARRPIFSREGRASKLTEDGQRLLDYAPASSSSISKPWLHFLTASCPAGCDWVFPTTTLTATFRRSWPVFRTATLLSNCP